MLLLTMGLLGLNCWGLSGLTNEFDKTWFFDPGYQRDFLDAARNLFPESGYMVDFYIGESRVHAMLIKCTQLNLLIKDPLTGDADYFREKEALEELFNRLSALPGIKNGTTKHWYHSFLEYLKDKEGKFSLILKASNYRTNASA